MKQAIVYSHKEVAHELKLLGEWLKNENIEVTRQYREEKWDREALLSSDLLIILGSPRTVVRSHINSPELLLATENEISLVKERLKLKKPFIGICYGAQVLGLAVDGEVIRRSEGPNSGYKTVETKTSDFMGPWLMWHEDAIVPQSLEDKKDVEIMATSNGCTGKGLVVFYYCCLFISYNSSSLQYLFVFFFFFVFVFVYWSFHVHFKRYFVQETPGVCSSIQKWMERHVLACFQL